jgi:hypothetical protein
MQNRQIHRCGQPARADRGSVACLRIAQTGRCMPLMAVALPLSPPAFEAAAEIRWKHRIE